MATGMAEHRQRRMDEMTSGTGQARRQRPARADRPDQSGRGRWRRWVRALWLGAVLVALIAVVADQWADVRASLSAVTSLQLVAAALTGLGSLVASTGLWLAVIRGLGGSLSVRAAAGLFGVSQLGKLLPGGVWPLLAHVEYGRDRGIPPRLAVAAFAALVWVQVATGLLMAAVSLPLAGVLPAWVLLLAIPVAALLWPRVLRFGIGLGLRLTRRAALPPLPDRSVAISVTCAAVMWLSYGLHLWTLAPEVGMVVALGAFAGSWAVGLLVLPAPAGAGIREAAVVFLLPMLSTGAALVVALLSRALLILADVVWAGLGWLLARQSP